MMGRGQTEIDAFVEFFGLTWRPVIVGIGLHGPTGPFQFYVSKQIQGDVHIGHYHIILIIA